jgi:type II secretory pathway pseudopilin PulG
MRSEHGSTLVEVLISVAILGIAGAALLGGVMTGISSANISQKQANTESILTSAVNTVKADSYVDCAPTYVTRPAGTTFPAGYTVLPPSISQWDGTDFEATNLGCARPNTLQIVRVTVAGPDRIRWYRDVVKGSLG